MTLKKILGGVKLLWQYKFDLFSIAYFNFKNFPFKQAIKIPVFLHKVELSGKGRYVIDTNVIYPGMIRIGYRLVKHFKDSGCIMRNDGLIVFRGNTRICNDTSVENKNTGKICFGDQFCATAGVKIVCCKSIIFNDFNLIGWNTWITDCSFHRLKTQNNNSYIGKGYNEVVIGSHNWISQRCSILSGTKTPDYCTVGANSLTNTSYLDTGTHILIAGIPAKVKKTGVWHDMTDDDLDRSELFPVL